MCVSHTLLEHGMMSIRGLCMNNVELAGSFLVVSWKLPEHVVIFRLCINHAELASSVFVALSKLPERGVATGVQEAARDRCIWGRGQGGHHPGRPLL